jgi:hypothetical protein
MASKAMTRVFFFMLLLIFRRKFLFLSSEAVGIETEIWFQITAPVYRTAKRHFPQEGNEGNLHSHYVLTHREKNEFLRNYHLVY